MSAMMVEEAGDPLFVLQIGHIHVEVLAVDTLHFQGDVVAEDFRDSPWNSQDRLRSTRGLQARSRLCGFGGLPLTRPELFL